MITQVELYDTNLNLIAYLENAFSVGYDKKLNEVHGCTFSLPYNDDKVSLCTAYSYVKLYESDGTFIDTYRIMPSKIYKDMDKNIITFDCEHVLSTLMDDILFQYHELTDYRISAIMTYVLTAQTTVKWNIGTVNITSSFTVKFENEYLLSALYMTATPITVNYQWTWQTSSGTTWNLNMSAGNTAIVSYIRYEKNLVNIEKEEDPRDVITKLYPLGYGEGVNQLTIDSVNSGINYITATTTAYGTISGFFIDKSEEDAQMLLEKAQAKLNDLSSPRVTYKVKAADLSSMTGKSIDYFVLGSYVNVYDSELNININARIVSVSKKDIIDQPHDIDIELSNKVQDLTDINTNLSRKSYINEVYSQGSTNIDSNDFQDNCDATHAALVKFYVPDEAIKVNKCLLTYESSAFRAYSTGTAGGGTAVVTSANGGTAVITSASGGTAVVTSASGGSSTPTSGGNDWYSDPGYTSGFSVTSTDGSHNHGGAVAADGSHTHAIADVNHSHDVSIPSHAHNVTLPSHTHEVTLPSHSHDVTLPSHTHAIQHGIYTYSALATSMVITVDTATVTVTSTSLANFDIIPHLTKDGDGNVTRGWHTVSILPNNLSRITANVVKQVYIQSRGSYTL